ncbi:transcriptional regulator [Flagellimonas halotolerans]|uniref:Transcriptional regulator n=1 Tax=Flagellimonas halotolerans TaxID=3112164 RepID=A0ABU6IT93_9FLAO|nr:MULTISPECIES: transcriptional regulator [unclassified Allomuricauda]MEC3966516.1 transcriptional regulator [Muricauda sp. SYSU M86414]MEC4266347.1 transcriptional regulator [Muricauda sp. SYSU M84420]
MVAILTGDIKNSTEYKTAKWLPVLKKALGHYGKEPTEWEIYRGDSFQLQTAPERALEASVYIKACIKQTRGLDVRIAIGLGEKTYDAGKITESNGGAFVHSGKCFENLKKLNLAIKTPNKVFDEHINLLLELALLTMDNWTPAISKTVKTAMENPDLNQKELASILNKSQGNISEELNKAGFDEVQKMIHFYRTQLAKL